jgi:hypothetical protein
MQLVSGFAWAVPGSWRRETDSWRYPLAMLV